MPRLMGVDIPANKPTHISLRYLVGIGPTTSLAPGRVIIIWST